MPRLITAAMIAREALKMADDFQLPLTGLAYSGADLEDVSNLIEVTLEHYRGRYALVVISSNLCFLKIGLRRILFTLYETSMPLSAFTGLILRPGLQ